MKKVLFVCLGNICRSPMAEAIFNKAIRDRGLEDHYLSDSCGTGDYHIGDQPDPRTVRISLRNDTPISHACRQVVPDDLRSFDYIFPMDASNLHNLKRLGGAHDHTGKIRLMREYDELDRGADVPDPYWGVDENFQEVYDILHRCIHAFLDADAG